MWTKNRAGLVTTALVALAACSPSSEGTLELDVQQEQAYLAGMQSDLQDLARKQEIYWADRSTYTDDFELLGFVSNTGVEVDIFAATVSGWAAVATHLGLPGRGCGLRYGRVQTVQTPGGQVVETFGETVCD